MTRRVMAVPYLCGLLVLIALPAVAAMGLAFTEFTGVNPPRYNGLDNVRRMIGDDGFWRSLGNSFVYAAVATPLRVAGAVAVALLLARRSRSVAVARPLAFLPSVLPDVAYALLWVWLLNPVYGPFVSLFDAVGDPATDPWAARIALPIAAAFQIGEGFVVALAARRALPNSLFEAARVDGGSPWYVTRRITLPLMAPVIGVLALRDLLLSFQTNFVAALVITEGGPRYATTYLPLYIYRTAFRYFRLGYASTLSLSLFLMTALAVAGSYLILRRWSYGRSPT